MQFLREFQSRKFHLIYKKILLNFKESLIQFSRKFYAIFEIIAQNFKEKFQVILKRIT